MLRNLSVEMDERFREMADGVERLARQIRETGANFSERLTQLEGRARLRDERLDVLLSAVDQDRLDLRQAVADLDERVRRLEQGPAA